MTSSARRAALAVAVLFSTAASFFAQSTSDRQVAKTPRGSVSGKITIKDKPAPGVSVGLRKGAMENSNDPFERAVTNAEGIYRLTNVPAGNYVVTVAAPAYVPTDSQDRKSIVVGEGENVEGLNFSLVRGGVITGKITDADGRPVMLHRVEIFYEQTLERREGAPLPFPTKTIQTDDRGIYRAFGIAPGRYKVGAGRGDDSAVGYAPTQINYKRIFYPDVADSAKATVIEVSAGGETKDVDITLGRAEQTFTVSGRIINGETSAPAPNMRVGLQRLVGQRAEFVTTMGVSNAGGNFTLDGLSPGKYRTMLLPNQGSDLRAEDSTFEIIDGNVSGLVIKLSRGASLSGTVVIETEDKAVKAQLTQMMLRGYVPLQPSAGYGGSTSSQIGADGSFRLAGLSSGRVNIALGGTAGPFPPKGFSILRLEHDGVIVPNVEIKEGEQVTGVKVVVAYGNATLRGVIKLVNGTLPPRGRVFVRITKMGETRYSLRPPNVDERGNFLVEGIPAGQYEVSATVMTGSMPAPATVKQQVSLTDGLVTDVEITIDAANPARP